MGGVNHIKQKGGWFAYLAHEQEPLTYKKQKNEITPEEIAELLDYSPFLKRRVLRKMHKINKQYSKPVSHGPKHQKFHMTYHHSF